MAMPFDFVGVASFSPSAFNMNRATERLISALASEGGKNFSVSDGHISFDGLTSYRSLHKLCNIQRGTIEIRSSSAKIEFRYSIWIERSPFYLFGIVLALGVGLAAAGTHTEQFSVALVFGAGGLVLSSMYSFAIRRRIDRWLLDVARHAVAA